MLSEQAPTHTPPPRRERSASLVHYIVVAALLLAAMPLMKMAADAHVPDKYATGVGLNELPKQVDEWKGEDRKLDKLSLQELEPDDYVWRVYTDPNGIPLDFLVVYGHLKKTFHSPGFCLPGGGWQIDQKSEMPVDSGGLPMEMNLFHIQREYEGHDYKQVVLYTFVQGENSTPSLITHNLNLLKARMLHERSTGALVRVIIPVVSTDDVAIARAKDFINRIYPDVRKRIG
jgi:EpsI family protein